MNYGEIKTNFQAILNRRDITPTLVETFISFSIQRAQRLLRVPAMEVGVTFTVDNTYTNGIVIPNDFIRMVSLTTEDDINNPVEVRQGSLQTALRRSLVPGYPEVYARNRGTFVIGPTPSAGTVFYLTYIANFDNLVADADSNWLTDVCPDVVIYGALDKAADYFLDERKQLFNDTFSSAISELNMQAVEEEMTGAVMGYAYGLDDGGDIG